jgi:iron complex transport system substrate-binding protein
MNLTRLGQCLLILMAAALPCSATRTLTDETGRTVLVADHPHRIICLAPSITDSVFALGAGDDVVAISDYVEYPAAALKKPSVGSILSPSIEAILNLHPDLVLGIPHLNDNSTFDQLRRLGLPVYLIDAHGLAGILRSITDIGQAINRPSQASTLVGQLQRRIDAVHSRVAGKPIVSVFMPLSYDPVVTIGKGSFITEIIAAAGGHSVTADIAQEWPLISMEAVIARAPQSLLLSKDGQITLAVLKTRPGWSNLAAVRAGRIYFVDKRIDLPSPVAIDALEELAQSLHPRS